MALAATSKQSAWNARLDRINSGRTMTQSADAEGTVPLRLTRRGEASSGARGLSAWIIGGVMGWGVGTFAAVVDPAAQILARVPLPEALEPHLEMIQSWGNPILALGVFMLALGILRVRGSFARLIGLVVMSYIFALQFHPETPTVAQLIEMGQAFLADEEALAGVRDAVVDWAMQEKA